MTEVWSLLGHLGGGSATDADLIAPFAIPVIILSLFGVSNLLNKRKIRGTIYSASAVALGVSAIILIPVLATPLAPGVGIISPAGTQTYVTPSSFVKEVLIPNSDARPQALAVDSEGRVWFAMNGKAKIAVYDPKAATPSFTEFTVPTVPASPTMEVWSMRVGENGDIWFPDVVSNSIWMFDVSRNAFRQFPIPTSNAFPVALVLDGKGDVWFTELNGNKIGKLTPSQATLVVNRGLVEFPVPTQKSGPLGITTDAAGNIWFTETFANKIAMLDSKSGAITEHIPVLPISSPYGLSSPYGIAIDKENNVWIAEHGGSRIIKYDTQTNSVSKFAMSPNRNYPISLIEKIVIDSYGNLWFNQHGGNRIAKLSPATGTLTEYNIPTGPNANALDLAQDSSGRMWFTELTANKIGVINPSTTSKFRIQADKDTVETTSSAAFTINLQIASSEPVELRASSSISYTGDLKDLTAQLPPRYVPNGTAPASIPIHFISNEKIEPGVHSITISASTQEVTQSIVITLIIKR